MALTRLAGWGERASGMVLRGGACYPPAAGGQSGGDATVGRWADVGRAIPRGDGRRGRWRLRACGGWLNRTGEVAVEPDGGKVMGKDGKPWAVTREADEMGANTENCLSAHGREVR